MVRRLVRRRLARLPAATHPPVFLSAKGLLRDPNNTIGDLCKALDRAGFPWATSHTFRRTVATRLDDAGLSARQIADHLGHSHPASSRTSTSVAALPVPWLHGPPAKPLIVLALRGLASHAAPWPCSLALLRRSSCAVPPLASLRPLATLKPPGVPSTMSSAQVTTPRPPHAVARCAVLGQAVGRGREGPVG